MFHNKRNKDNYIADICANYRKYKNIKDVVKHTLYAPWLIEEIVLKLKLYKRYGTNYS